MKRQCILFKKVNINLKDVIINGDLNENSKITKIEYRNIQGVQKCLFGQEGPIEKLISMVNLESPLMKTLDKRIKTNV